MKEEITSRLGEEYATVVKIQLDRFAELTKELGITNENVKIVKEWYQLAIELGKKQAIVMK